MHVSNFLLLVATLVLGSPLSPPSAPSLAYLFTVQATESSPVIIGNSGHGTRLVIPITGGTVTGPKLNGTVLALGGDWGSYDVYNKTFVPDAKIVVQTGDGANILFTGYGKSPYINYEFETGSTVYSWLNQIIGIGIIQVGEASLRANIFQVSVIRLVNPSTQSMFRPLAHFSGLAALMSLELIECGFD
ncbi:hypothetical protein F5Y19DRAFT_483232 [Xylariaceae sp. FL1651]|nr:hypothetical protein F5Y19DRAFT_483232 [Xylariaceae sp. FL1651]